MYVRYLLVTSIPKTTQFCRYIDHIHVPSGIKRCKPKALNSNRINFQMDQVIQVTRELVTEDHRVGTVDAWLFGTRFTTR